MLASKPILRDFPDCFESERLIIRAPRIGDGQLCNEAIIDSFPELQQWMSWAKFKPSIEETEVICREALLNFIARVDLQLYLISKSDNSFVGASGLHRIDWSVPKFEIGYWCRTQYLGNGYIKEAVHRIATFAFETLGARRVEIKVDEKNVRSWNVPEKLGFKHEGTIKNDALDCQGNLRHTKIYGITSIAELRNL
jgi:RimJ/RimL family protein N-acetyltransferase